jgi:hypothetical protein
LETSEEASRQVPSNTCFCSKFSLTPYPQAAHKKVLDVANTLGLSNSLIRIIERREGMDKLIVYGGMFLTLCLLAWCYSYMTGTIDVGEQQASGSAGPVR